MAATVWKGQLAFGLVSIPVRLVRAARAQRVPLRQLYRPKEHRAATPAPVTQPDLPAGPGRDSSYAEAEDSPAPAEISGVIPVQRVYQAAGGAPFNGEERPEPIQHADLVTGYETSQGQYVVLEEDELRQLAPKTSTEIEIVEFVRFEEIDPVYLETSYYVIPEATGEKAYALLYDAMRDERYAAVANISMHRRDHVLIVRTGKTGLLAHTMFYPDEVRSIEEFRTDTALASTKELHLARTLIEALAKPFDPSRFENQFRARLQALIESRAAEAPAIRVEAPKPGKVIDIMDALRRSLAEVKPAERPGPRVPESAGRKPARTEQPASRTRKSSR